MIQEPAHVLDGLARVAPELGDRVAADVDDPREKVRPPFLVSF